MEFWEFGGGILGIWGWNFGGNFGNLGLEFWEFGKFGIGIFFCGNFVNLGIFGFNFVLWTFGNLEILGVWEFWD